MAILSLNETTTFRWSFEDDVATLCRGGHRGHRRLAAEAFRLRPGSGPGTDPAAPPEGFAFVLGGGIYGQRGSQLSRKRGRYGRRPADGRGAGGRVPGGVQRRTGRPHLQPCAATRPGRAEGTGAAGRGIRRGDGPGADAPGLCRSMHVPQQSRRRPGHYPGHRPSACETVLDTYHLGQDPGLVERIPQIASQIALVQLGDAKCPPQGEQNRCRLGDGIVPLRQIVCALRARDTMASSTWNCWAKTSRPWIITTCWPTPRKHLPS